MSNVPMTSPEEALAVHEDPQFRSSALVALDDGRVLQTSGGKFTSSEDGGITWSEPFQRHDKNGDLVSPNQLVDLAGGAIGAISATRDPDAPQFSAEARRSVYYQFRRSDDGGETWSEPFDMRPPGITMHAYQDTVIRTSSGRLVLPLYMSIGQGTWHQEGEPFVGGYMNGNFVSTDAHFLDPHFTASYVVYSDDEGRTWETNRDGELFIIMSQDKRRQEWTNEPSVVEVSPSKLLMIMRTRVGRLFQSWSEDDGTSWSRPEATQLAGTNAPGQIRKLPGTGHLLVVWTQQSEREIRQGFIRTRLSSAVSRNGGGVWEKFQNVESLHEETHVEPGPIEWVRPEAASSILPGAALEADPEYAIELPEGYGRWSYPSVLVLEDRVLITHSYSIHDSITGEAPNGAKLKVLPITWFYGGQDPTEESTLLQKIEGLPPRP